MREGLGHTSWKAKVVMFYLGEHQGPSSDLRQAEGQHEAQTVRSLQAVREGHSAISATTPQATAGSPSLLPPTL